MNILYYLKLLDLRIIYIITRDCTRVGAFPRAFCVPNSVALASLTLQVARSWRMPSFSLRDRQAALHWLIRYGRFG